MSKVVNLNKARKARARSDRKTRADENAVKFGRSKAEKLKSRTELEKSARDLDSHKRE